MLGAKPHLLTQGRAVGGRTTPVRPRQQLQACGRPYRRVLRPVALSFPGAELLLEPAAQDMLLRMLREPLQVESLQREVDTAFVGPTQEAASSSEPSASPVVLLHGFDSSSLEFRRLYPLLEGQVETYAVDLVGWGFSDATFFEGPSAPRQLSPSDKRAHLLAFWREKIGRPMTLVGASLGGAVAMDFALHHPEAVERLVLIDAQGFIDGIGPMSSLPRPLAVMGVKLLGTVALRQAANRMAYHDPSLASEDAMRVGRLHTLLPGWVDANVAFMSSGGYQISERIAQVQQPTLVLWGRQDQILEPSSAERFLQTLPNSRLEWIEECGHCPHLEQPARTAELVLEFVRSVALLQGGVPAAA